MHINFHTNHMDFGKVAAEVHFTEKVLSKYLENINKSVYFARCLQIRLCLLAQRINQATENSGPLQKSSPEYLEHWR